MCYAKKLYLGRTDFRAVNFKMVKLKKHFVIRAETISFQYTWIVKK